MANSANDAATGFRIMMVERTIERDASLGAAIKQLGQSLGNEVSEQQAGAQSYAQQVDKTHQL